MQEAQAGVRAALERAVEELSGLLVTAPGGYAATWWRRGR